MLFTIAILLGLISLGLMVFGQPALGIIGLIFCALIIVANNNRQKRNLEAQRHQEIVEAMKNK